MTKNIHFGWTLYSVRFLTRLKNTSPSVQCVFMFGVSPIEMIVGKSSILFDICAKVVHKVKKNRFLQLPNHMEKEKEIRKYGKANCEY